VPDVPVALALSDSPLARTLGADLPVEYLETSGPHLFSAARECQKPLLLHNSVWNWSLADSETLGEVVQTTHQALAETRASWLSVHLGFSVVRVAFANGMQPASEVLARDVLLTRFRETILVLKAGLDVPLLLENLDYNATGAYEHICEPGFIREVLEATDTFFLLDLAHAQVSASRLGYDPEVYFEQLPLERVRQLHISGPRVRGGTLDDAHEPLRPEDYALLKDILKRTKPWAITLEYSRDAGALREQLSELGRILAQTVD
jgi:uncharacterized protein (UPF0276 family)